MRVVETPVGDTDDDPSSRIGIWQVYARIYTVHMAVLTSAVQILRRKGKYYGHEKNGNKQLLHIVSHLIMIMQNLNCKNTKNIAKVIIYFDMRSTASRNTSQKGICLRRDRSSRLRYHWCLPFSVVFMMQLKAAMSG